MSYPSGSGGNSQQNPFQYLQQIEFERYQNARMNLNPGNEVANKDEKKKEEQNCPWSEIQAGSLIKEFCYILLTIWSMLHCQGTALKANCSVDMPHRL